MAAWNSPENPNFALFQHIEFVVFVSDHEAIAHSCVPSYVILGRFFFFFFTPATITLQSRFNECQLLRPIIAHS